GGGVGHQLHPGVGLGGELVGGLVVGVLVGRHEGGVGRELVALEPGGGALRAHPGGPHGGGHGGGVEGVPAEDLAQEPLGPGGLDQRHQVGGAGAGDEQDVGVHRQGLGHGLVDVAGAVGVGDVGGEGDVVGRHGVGGDIALLHAQCVGCARVEDGRGGRMGGLGVLGDVGRDRCGFPEGVPEDPGARVGAVADDAQAGVAGGHHHRVVAVGHCVGGGGGVGEAGAEDGQDVVVGDQRGGGRRRCGGHRVVVADGENDLGALHPTG